MQLLRVLFFSIEADASQNLLCSFSFPFLHPVSVAHLKHISMRRPAAGFDYGTTDRCQNAARLSRSQTTPHALFGPINSPDREAFLAPRLLYVLQFVVVSLAPVKNGKGD